MKYPQELLEAVRKILNETRQDPACRLFLQDKQVPGLLPYLGTHNPMFLFLGLNPAGYTLGEIPTAAADYLDFARGYFSSEESDRGSFAHYLPLTANYSGDYATFGEVSMVTYMVPIPTRRSSEIGEAMVEACWPRLTALLATVRPKLMILHGALVWKFLAGMTDGISRLQELPQGHGIPLQELYAQMQGPSIPFQTRVQEMPEDFRPWVLPVPHLGKAIPGREFRHKTDEAADRARRLMHGTQGGSRIRVRRPV
ncbi:MAG: hypothetical protein HY319_21805 [Armatimonadetes bacterium]|nr:hypothetical protein [Armatimonadota bacterium]